MSPNTSDDTPSLDPVRCTVVRLLEGMSAVAPRQLFNTLRACEKNFAETAVVRVIASLVAERAVELVLGPEDHGGHLVSCIRWTANLSERASPANATALAA